LLSWRGLLQAVHWEAEEQAEQPEGQAEHTPLFPKVPEEQLLRHWPLLRKREGEQERQEVPELQRAQPWKQLPAVVWLFS
jgi:hypothetical protein